jgi:prolyl-tRNA synthetase
MHRWSKLFIPTLREAPADAEVASHKFLLRAGYVRQLGSGIYSYLFLAQRSINKIIAIVREEMDTIGQEFLLPALNPREVWEASGRWSVMGDNMFRLKDRKGAELCLGMTHEEVMTEIARKELRSYKQLPQIWYQIQTKFRDEPRPKSGLLRVRQFTMKDSYSFDIDAAGLDKSFELHDQVYRRIFSRCGLKFVAVEADSGSMGGSQSQEFMVYTDAGEDLIASCPACGYAANMEKATSKLTTVTGLTATSDEPELVETPTQKTIEEVATFLGVEQTQQIKAMAYIATIAVKDGTQAIPVAVFLRGDHQVNEAKLSSTVGALEVRPMQEEEIIASFGSVPGFLGPVGLIVASKAGEKGVLVVLDKALEGRTNLIAGANKAGFHLRNVTPGRDFTPTTIADIRNANAGESCPRCGKGALVVGKAVEIGHIFKLGYKYTKSMGASVLDLNGKEVTPIMGSYGIGIERILTAAIEQYSAETKDENGFVLTPAIAPFDVVVTVTNIGEEALSAAGESVAAQLEAAGFDVLLDDRKERAGVKFKDADLVGIPYRVNIGKKVVDGLAELVDRISNSTEDVALDKIAGALRSRIAKIS